MSTKALADLIGMGIPAGRARAALLKAKGDAMSAAERVFAGEFDDVPSDGEEADEPQIQNHSQAPDTPHASGNGDLDADEEEDMEVDDYPTLDEGYVDNDVGHTSLDPYANVFFSKERTEQVVEQIRKVEKREVLLDGAIPIQVEILSREVWMSGCPEGNEQSFLFQLYSILSEGSCSCASGCGQATARNVTQFFPLFDDFDQYLQHLKAILRMTCPQCSMSTCLACGEKCDSPGPSKRVVKDNKNDLSARTLLHCPNAQGAVVGVGLHYIERAFATPVGQPTRAPAPSTKRKRRRGTKIGNLVGSANVLAKMSLTPAPTDEDDDDEDEDAWDVYHSSGGKKAASGTGYAGSGSENRAGQDAAVKRQKELDSVTTKLLDQVRLYLPMMDRIGGPTFPDHMVHPTALANLRRRSGFVNDLLRNDSLLDMSERSDLYRALFDWLEAISRHESLSSMLAMPQMRPGRVEPAANDPQSRTVTYEGSSSPRELLENCVIQAQAAVKGLGASEACQEPDSGQGSDDTDENNSLQREQETKRDQPVPQKLDGKTDELQTPADHVKAGLDQLRGFCERIIASATMIDKSLVETKGMPFVTRMRESLPHIGRIQEISHSSSDDQVVKDYENWAREARFQYSDMAEISTKVATAVKSDSSEGPSYRHAYTSELKAISREAAPKRSLAIAKELAILTTSLPAAWHSAIFLRVDETRVDCLKAMIIGPEGTPYENGCFLFDIFLPFSYNQICPKVKTMTTNGGKYRYNPNLYADGVCLSLLGTWQGPGWIAGKSTLLQVLISIQSLILNEEPYLNEPGWAGDGGTAASKAYSANVRKMVLKDAMANNIKKPPFPFENEIKTHFRLKAKSIKAQLDRWKALDDGKAVSGDGHYGGTYSGSRAVTSASSGQSSSSPFDQAASALRDLLDGLVEKAAKESEASAFSAIVFDS